MINVEIRIETKTCDLLTINHLDCNICIYDICSITNYNVQIEYKKWTYHFYTLFLTAAATKLFGGLLLIQRYLYHHDQYLYGPVGRNIPTGSLKEVCPTYYLLQVYK